MTTGFSGRNIDFIVSELGERLQRKRLNRDLTQQQLGELSGTSRNIVKNAEKGQVSLPNLVAILKGLGELESLDAFLFEPEISPIEMLKLRGKVRQRAGGKRQTTQSSSTDEDVEW